MNAQRLLWGVLGFGLVACAEAKPDFAGVPVPPVVPDSAVDAPVPPDAAPVPDAPTLDAAQDSAPDAAPDAPTPDAGPDATPDATVDAVPDAPIVLLPADICDTAVDITAASKLAGGYATQDTTVGFHQNAYASCGFSNYQGVDRVYRVDTAVGDILTVLATPLDPNPVDMAIALLQGCGAGEMCIRSADAGFTGDEEIFVIVMQAAGPHYLYIDSYSAGSSGAFSLNVILSTPPTN